MIAMAMLVASALAFALALGGSAFGGSGFETTVPPLEEGIPAWLTARDWLSTGDVPATDAERARIPLQDVSAVGVTLRLDGRVVGRGSDPGGDDQAIRRAFGRALAQALGDRTIRDLPDPWRSNPGSRLCLELELAGTRQPLVGSTLAAAARRLRPGIDGVAVVRGEGVAMAMPGRLLSTGTADALASTLIRLLDEVGLPARDLPELRRIDSVRLERFETLRIGQSTPDAMPETRTRLGPPVGRTDLDGPQLASLSAALQDRLVRWQAPPDPANPDDARPWLGDFDPIGGTHTPLEATPTDRLLAIWALRQSGRTDSAVPRPDTFEATEITPAMIDLALLAAGSGDPDAARAWLDRLDVAPAEVTAETSTSPLARRAAALGMLPTEVVPNDRSDDAHQRVWATCDSVTDVLAAFDWLCLAEYGWWWRHGEPGPRVASLRAVRDALLARQITDPFSDLDGSIPLRAGAEEVSDARVLRLLVGMSALAIIPDDDDRSRTRGARGLAGLLRFLRQLQVTPEEAADLPDGRRALHGLQAAPADPRQPLVATAMALIAVDLLRETAP